MRALILLMAACAPGCFWATTKSEGETMAAQIKDLDGRVAKEEQSIDQRVKTLDESIDKATKLLARNSADLGTQVDKFSEELAAALGQIDIMKRTVEALRGQNEQLLQQKAADEAAIAALTARVDAIEKKPSGPPPLDKGQLYEMAMQNLQANHFADARKLFRQYVLTYPQDDKADDAQYHVGESFYKEKDYDHAIAEFQKVIDLWPKGDMADDAYLAAGNAALDEQECRVAKVYLTELLKHFPDTPFKKTAQQKLDLITKKVKDPKVCKPG
jgi:tol-pal system protein YbgF